MLEQILMGAIILIAFIQSIRVINLKEKLTKIEKAFKQSKITFQIRGKDLVGYVENYSDNEAKTNRS